MAINVNPPSKVVRNYGCQAQGDNSLSAVRRHSDYHWHRRKSWTKGQGSTNGSHRDNSMPFMWRSATVGSAKDDVKRALRDGKDLCIKRGSLNSGQDFAEGSRPLPLMQEIASVYANERLEIPRSREGTFLRGSFLARWLNRPPRMPQELRRR
jgi:hypothetical protein